MNKKNFPVIGLAVMAAIGAANAKMGTCPSQHEPAVFYKAFDDKTSCEKDGKDPLVYKGNQHTLASLPNRCVEDKSTFGSAWYACYHKDILMKELKSKESKK